MNTTVAAAAPTSVLPTFMMMTGLRAAAAFSNARRSPSPLLQPSRDAQMTRVPGSSAR